MSEARPIVVKPHLNFSRIGNQPFSGEANARASTGKVYVCLQLHSHPLRYKQLDPNNDPLLKTLILVPNAYATDLILFGSASPAMIIHRNPGKRVNGTRNSAFGTTRLIQLSSPISAIKRPGMTIHLGSSFMIKAGTQIPAISRPNGTENPLPPSAWSNQ